MEEEVYTLKKKLVSEQRGILYNKILNSRQMVFGTAIVAIIVLAALLAPVITIYSPYQAEMNDRLLSPSDVHPFGTDALGRDLFSRVIYGARISLLVGGSVGLISGFVGLTIGLYASYYSALDNLIMRVCDGLRAIPSILLAITLMTVLGADIKNVIISLTVVSTPGIARMARSAALLVKERAYIEAMRAQGAGSARILWMHIAPNIASTVLVQVTFVVASAIISEASLSFLGAGVPPSEPSWGSILSEGRNFIYNSWWMILFPGIATASTVLGLNLIGDGLRDILDPKTN